MLIYSTNLVHVKSNPIAKPIITCHLLLGLSKTHHVYENGGVIYNAVLGLVDIVQGTNSFYKLQLLEADSSKKCPP